MRSLAFGLLSGLAILVAACKGAAPETVSPLPGEEAWDLAAVRSELVDASCPDEVGEGFQLSFLVAADAVALGAPDRIEKTVTGLSYLGGWALSATPASFGGLSGLKVMPSGDLLAVSDAGALVELGFDQTAVQPTGEATLSFLRGGNGEMLTGKAEADSEGLDYADGIALVSFERDHRIAAFAYGVCGSNARAVPVSSFADRPETPALSIPGNSGPEALMLRDGQLVAGLETVVDGRSPVAVVDEAGVPQFAALDWYQGERLPLVGFDALDGVVYALHRAWNPLTGNSLLVTKHAPDEEPVTLARLSRPLTVDNFEGIAVSQRPDGSTRLFLIADDNFSDDQQTLLFAFEVTG
ncbi:esterase-like activity of phytase family protein [Henriciella aquimarina]|uniref:esterase-like activity of phytase family protein n=1 Tax=Henriciella aquimarina TaxID=545261 RepID=UPI000A053AE9|nr:esterase-like activity of phytase family protein [Henriciella aquimarina]